MALKDFENTLKNIENDKMLMAYGDNQTVINSILSIVNLVQTLESVIRSDRNSDMFTMNISGKIIELEQMIVMLGNQRLMQRGINSGGSHGGQQFNPFMANTPMYNQQMYPNSMMYNPMMSQQFAQVQPMFQQPITQQPVYQQPIIQQPVYQQPATMPQPAQQSAPQPAMPAQQSAPAPRPQADYQPQEPAVAPKAEPAAIIDASTRPKSSGTSSGGFSLPGLDGGGSDAPEGKAAGRDYLIKLLEEK